MDSFALPVEGTETRVNAQAQGYEYMTEYIEAAKKVIEGGHLLNGQESQNVASNAGREDGERHRLVPLAPRLRLLALRHRRLHADAQPKLSGELISSDIPGFRVI